MIWAKWSRQKYSRQGGRLGCRAYRADGTTWGFDGLSANELMSPRVVQSLPDTFSTLSPEPSVCTLATQIHLIYSGTHIK